MKRPNGPLMKWRVCVSQRFSCHSPNSSSHFTRIGPYLMLARRWMRPSASARSSTLYAGMPAISLMRALSATKGQIVSGG
jgi:hypothetical protein